MITSRTYRKQVSLITLMGATFRLTDDFLALLAMAISRGESLQPTDVQYMTTTAGSTPMTLSELYELRDAIADMVSDARREEAVISG